MQPTRPHHADPAPRLLISQSTDEKDILLSYYRRPTLKVDDVVIVENIRTGSYDYEPERVVEMFPNTAGILCDENWQTEHECTWAEVTDVFAGDIPLFYVYVCKLLSPTADTASVRIALKDGRPLPNNLIYLINAEPEGKGYRIFIYTNFTRDDEYVVKYSALDERGNLVEREEDLCPYPVGVVSQDAVEGLAGIVYFIAPGRDFGTRKIMVHDGIVKDERRPLFFRYRIKAEVIKSDGSKQVYYSPWRADYVHHPDNVLPFDNEVYVNGRKRLTDRSTAEIMRQYYDLELDSAAVIYSVESDNQDVAVFCRVDGEGFIFASTTKKTGTLNPRLTEPGRKWKVIELTKDNQKRLGIDIGSRQMKLLVTGTKNGQQLYSSVFEIANEYNFGSTSVIIKPKDIAMLPGDARIEVSVYGNAAGIDLQVFLGGAPYPGTSATVSEIVSAGGMTVVVSEVYKIRCFAKVYAVKFTRRQLEVFAKDAGEDDQWHLVMRRGTRVVPKDADRFYAYELHAPDIIPAIETRPEIVSEDTIRLRHVPVLAGIKRDGSVFGVNVWHNGEAVEIDYCDVYSGIIKLKEPVPSSGITIEYRYNPDNIEYKGFECEGKFFRLDLNPQFGHTSVFKDSLQEEVPTWSLIGKEVYLCAAPSAVVTYKHTKIQDIMSFVKYERVDGVLAVRVRLSHRPTGWDTVKVYRYRDGVEIPYGSGQAFWVEASNSDVEILVVDPDMQIDPFGRLEEIYCADYIYISNTLQVERTMQPSIYHSLTLPEDESHTVLAKIRLSFPYTTDDMDIIDARQRGGGVEEELLDRAAAIEPESRHYFDIGYWDGEPWQRNGLIRVLLPEKLKEEKGYTDDFIRKKVSRFKAAGVYPLIEFWDAEDVYPARPGHVKLDLCDVEDEAARITKVRHLVLSLTNETASTTPD